MKKKPMSRVVPRTGTNCPPKNKRLPMSVWHSKYSSVVKQIYNI